jgi:hypothetical protein
MHCDIKILFFVLVNILDQAAALHGHVSTGLNKLDGLGCWELPAPGTFGVVLARDKMGNTSAHSRHSFAAPVTRRSTSGNEYAILRRGVGILVIIIT